MCKKTAQEAGCVVTGSPEVYKTTVSTDSWGVITEDILGGRKHFVLRAIADTDKESGKDAQKRIMGEFYGTVEDMDPLK
jgi:myo-inositol-1(or 4)-monophosphatase